MKPILAELERYQREVADATARLDIAADEAKLAYLETQMQKPDFWQDSTTAEQVSREAADLRRSIMQWRSLSHDLDSLVELVETTPEQEQSALESDLADIRHRFEDLMQITKLSGPYDKRPAIMQISAGVGGTDAQDWAQMLLAMYTKYCEREGWQAELVDVSHGEEAGIKSATLEVTGPFAYGKLRGEKGVHRLVRISPFNAQSLRQTSFALVDVVPEIEGAEAEIDPKDLRIDTYRSSGHGGQSVNTTDSAVRITHIPTGIVVAIQNERSQLKNKTKAMSILASRLAEYAREQDKAAISELRGQLKSADWGSQIRSYVLHPYTKVKDYRTGHETSDTAGVLGGALEPFVAAYLNYSLGR